MPYCQFGAVRGGGTDAAHHFLIGAMDYAKHMALSIFVLFVDLAKEFDKVLHEFVVGSPQNISLAERYSYLIGMGLSHDAATWVIEFIEKNGSAFTSWGVDAKVEALINGLHTKA
eukprot:1138258-Heterocapsa_arctica.AAC.1